jgi:hypothetical protein
MSMAQPFVYSRQHAGCTGGSMSSSASDNICDDPDVCRIGRPDQLAGELLKVSC